jgi:hypothetical protein
MSCSESDSSDLTSISPLSQERQDKPDRYRNKQARQHSADAKKKPLQKACRRKDETHACTNTGFATMPIPLLARSPSPLTAPISPPPPPPLPRPPTL